MHRSALLLATAGLLGLPGHAGAQATGFHALVDRLSTRLDPAMGGPAEEEHFRSLEPLESAGERITVVGATWLGAGPPGPEQVHRIRLLVRQPGSGPRLLLIDAGPVFRGPAGADFVAVPNQRFVVERAEQGVEIDALPLWPDKPAPPENTPLSAVRSNDPGLIAVLRTVQRIETQDAQRARRYVKESGGGFAVDTHLDNLDVQLARWMSWTRDPAGQAQGRFPRDALRAAVFAVTAGFTIQETADWLRRDRGLDPDAAVAAAWAVAKPTEYLLERAGLNFGVFSPAHATFHYNAGVRAFRRNDLEAAEKAFRTAISKQTGYVEAHYDLGVTLYRAGKYAEAEEMFQVASGMAGATPNVFFNRGATLYRLGDKPGAARMFRRVLELNPRDPDAAAWLEKADPDGDTAPKRPPPRPGPPAKRRR